MDLSYNLHSAKLADLRGIKKAWSKRLFKAPRVAVFSAFAASSAAPDQNVVGIGIGEQMDGDQPTGVMAIKFFVRIKYPKHELTAKVMLPKQIDGVPVDVEQTGLFRKFPAPAPLPNPKQRFRPAQPGCSCGYEDPNHQVVMAGTFGAVVKDKNGLHILSNNHVLADENRLAIGAPIFQPGLLDGGSAGTDKIATLTRFVPFKSSGNNKVDAAIAAVTKASIVKKDILHIGPPKGQTKAMLDMIVHKFGRTTSYTVGRVISVDADVTVGYDTGNYTFLDQILVVGNGGKPFSAAGDSGSLILERSTNQAVGLLFAGSSSHTIANHIDVVLKAMKVTLP